MFKDGLSVTVPVGRVPAVHAKTLIITVLGVFNAVATEFVSPGIPN